jgi:pyridoxamine 5'-phosphate oxidase
MSLRDIRKDHLLMTLSESDLDPDPIRQFEYWLGDAIRADLPEPNAMALATATPDGRPSVRIVLLRELDQRGFAFFTSFASRKSQEMDANPFAAMVFHWVELERQVRVEGRVERVSDAESDSYFATRPVGSRLGAWASQQSVVIPNRECLEAEHRALAERFAGDAIPRPPHWGGYRLIPDQIEFWQGRPSRLHDRLRYAKRPDGSWHIERLAP